MKNITIKNLIMLSVVFAATFAFSNSVSAFVCSGYDCDYSSSYRSLDNDFRSVDRGFDSTDDNHYQSSSSSSYSYNRNSNSDSNSNNTNSSEKNFTNDSNSQSSTSSTLDENNNEKVDGDSDDNLLGASAFGSLTALSLGGSHSFMPSSVWQWVLVFFLLLVVIILFRIVLHNIRSKSN